MCKTRNCITFLIKCVNFYTYYLERIEMFFNFVIRS